MSDYPRGWYAEQDEDGWRGVLQLDGYVATLDGPWFRTEVECDRWLRTEVVGRGMWNDDRESARD